MGNQHACARTDIYALMVSAKVRCKRVTLSNKKASEAALLAVCGILYKLKRVKLAGRGQHMTKAVNIIFLF